MKGIRCDVEKRIEAAIAYLITGDTEEAGNLCGIAGRTIRYWMKEQWWEDVLSQARTIKQKELDALWTGLIHKSTTALKKAIEEGDTVMNKLGYPVHVPVKAKDLAVITSILVDKRALQRGQATSRTEKVTIEQKLEKLKAGFKDIGTKEEPIDGPEDTESVH